MYRNAGKLLFYLAASKMETLEFTKTPLALRMGQVNALNNRAAYRKSRTFGFCQLQMWRELQAMHRIDRRIFL